MNILIIEDRKGQAQLIQKIIQKNSSHQVLYCEDAFDGYVMMKALDTLDVVILDNELPYASGLDFLQKIKASETFKELPVIMSTADEDYESFKCLGANYCLHKPFGKQDLMEILEQVEG